MLHLEIALEITREYVHEQHQNVNYLPLIERKIDTNITIAGLRVLKTSHVLNTLNKK